MPVSRNAQGALIGVEAVVDKDLAAVVLAEAVGADALLLLTTSRPFISAGAPRTASRSGAWTVEAAAAGVATGVFAAGSMGPKVTAAADFVRRTGGSPRSGRSKRPPRCSRNARERGSSRPRTCRPSLNRLHADPPVGHLGRPAADRRPPVLVAGDVTAGDRPPRPGAVGTAAARGRVAPRAGCRGRPVSPRQVLAPASSRLGRLRKKARRVRSTMSTVSSVTTDSMNHPLRKRVASAPNPMRSTAKVRKSKARNGSRARSARPSCEAPSGPPH